MRKIIICVTAVLLSIYLQAGGTTGSVNELWRKYTDAADSDRPQTQLEILEQIISVAKDGRLVWDFYDAWNKKVSVTSRVNWKQYEGVNSARKQAFKEFNEPVISLLSNGYRFSDIIGSKDRLSAAHNQGFYKDLPFIYSDYEYLLWRLGDGGEACFAEKLSVFGPVMKLSKEQDDLCKTFFDKNLTEAQCKQLRSLCTDFESRRASLKGRDAQIAKTFTRVEQLIASLDKSQLDLTAEGNFLKLVFRNLASADLVVRNEKGEAVFQKKVVNPKNTYYLPDTVAVPMPDVDDGNYEAVASCTAGKKEVLERSCQLQRRHISAQVSKSDKGGWDIVAAVFDSGEPINDFQINNIGEAGDTFRLTCLRKGFLWTSPVIRTEIFNYIEREHGAEKPVLQALIFPDCGLYRRGDRVRFKTVLGRGFYQDEARTVESGLAFEVALVSPDEAVVDSKSLVTDEFGAAAGEFLLPADAKGGYYSLVLKMDGDAVAMSSLRVDDAVLSEFYCVFDRIDTLYFPGDTVWVTGCFRAYSGGAPTLASASFEPFGGESAVAALDVSQEGRFSIALPTKKEDYWNTGLIVRASSKSGETHEFSRYVPLRDKLGLGVDIDGALEGNILESRVLRFVVKASNAEGAQQRMWTEYRLSSLGREITAGRAMTGDTVVLNLPAGVNCRNHRGDQQRESREYQLRVSAGPQGHETSLVKQFFKVDRRGDRIEADVENLFVPWDRDKDISFTFAATRGKVWADARLYGQGARLLWHSKLVLDGRSGQKGSMKTVSIPWPEGVDRAKLVVSYFRNATQYKLSHEFDRSSADGELKLEWTRFRDLARPGTEYSFRLKSSLPSQAVVAIFDKSTEELNRNEWRAPLRRPREISEPKAVTECGGLGEMKVMRMMYAGKAAAADGLAVAEEGAVNSLSVDGTSAVAAAVEEVAVRRDFAPVLAWAPFVQLGPEKEASVEFRTADKLSTFIVSTFAHDKSMRGMVLRREMTVGLPVQLEVTPPVRLMAGDRYVLNAALRVNAAFLQQDGGSKELSGRLKLTVAPVGGTRVTASAPVPAGSDACDAAPIEFTREVTVPAGGAVEAFPLEVPEGIDSLDVRVSFICDRAGYSDALAFKVPVMPASETLKEAYSMLMGPGDDSLSARNTLAARFTLLDPSRAVYNERSLGEMVREMLASGASVPPRHLRTNADLRTSLDLSEAICTDELLRTLGGTTMAEAVRKDVEERFGRCFCPDGGIAWIEGMTSSPLVTATVLGRAARLASCDLLSSEQTTAVVQYLDSVIFTQKYHFSKGGGWLPSISLIQYLYIRSAFPGVAFHYPAALSYDSRKAFASEVKACLLPAKKRGFEGRVLDKTLRATTLSNLASNGEAAALLKSWGVRTTRHSLRKSLQKDVNSIAEYTVSHSEGGKYLPNLVMPFRGLLSNEAYCHSLFCDLMNDYRPDLSEGIRLWLMLQKETQQWDSNFAFINAVASILDGSEKTLSARVAVLSAEGVLPLREVVASGNGMTVERLVSAAPAVVAASGAAPAAGSAGLASTGDLASADVAVGQKVTVTLRITSEENRSFVHIDLPYPACATPCNQLSGCYGWYWRAIDVAGGSAFIPQGYRETHPGHITYDFDLWPEGVVELTEDFFVTSEGIFSSYVPTVECEYAPHYSANAQFDGVVRAQR